MNAFDDGGEVLLQVPSQVKLLSGPVHHDFGPGRGEDVVEVAEDLVSPAEQPKTLKIIELID